jgi:Plant transposon protein
MGSILNGQSLSVPTPIQQRRRKKFAKAQESIRKHVECAFGIVVQRFHVLKRPLRGWYQEDFLSDLVHCCTILHNRIVVERFGIVGALS